MLFFVLISYIFNAKLPQYQKELIIKKYDIPITIEKEKNNSLKKLYENGSYKEYIFNFKKLKSFPKDEELYINYLLSLKIIKSKNYREQLCLIKGSVASFKTIPSFILSDMPEKCNLLKVKVLLNNNYNVYINGLEVLDNEINLNEIPYYLEVCKNEICKKSQEYSKNIDKRFLEDFLKTYLKNGYIISHETNIREIKKERYLDIYKSKIIYYFYMKNNKIYVDILKDNNYTTEIISFEKEISKKISKRISYKRVKKVPFYKKWYFYTAIVTVTTVSVLTIYFLNSDSNNTKIVWLPQ